MTAIVEQPKNLRAAVHQITDDVEAMRHMNILLRAGQAEKIMQKTVAWMLAVVDRLESLEARKKP